MTEMKIVEYGKQNQEVILLLHGGGLSWWNYRSEAELLSDRYHVVLPILDGHADSDEDFEGIEENAARMISHIDREYGGSVLFIGGLSLGAQILVAAGIAGISSLQIMPFLFYQFLLTICLVISILLERKDKKA